MEPEQLARDIIAARRERRTLSRPTERHDPFNLANAYLVAQRVSARWTDLGHIPCGVKIGLTYRGVWERLGLNRPVWAPMYQDGVVCGTEVSVGDLVAPRIEAEVVVKLASALGPGASSEEISQAVEWAALGFELVDCHYPGWQLTPADLIADFGCHARLVVGQRMVESAQVHEGALAELNMTLVCDGEPVAAGGGADVLGGPLTALCELLAAADAPQLQAGDLVATGALTRGALPVTVGQCWQAIPTSRSPFSPSAVSITA